MWRVWAAACRQQSGALPIGDSPCPSLPTANRAVFHAPFHRAVTAAVSGLAWWNKEPPTATRDASERKGLCQRHHSLHLFAPMPENAAPRARLVALAAGAGAAGLFAAIFWRRAANRRDTQPTTCAIATPPPSPPQPPSYTAATPAIARVASVDHVTGGDDDESDITLVTLTVPPSLTWTPGDAAGLHLPNPLSEVTDLLAAAGLGTGDGVTAAVPSWHWYGGGSLGAPGTPTSFFSLLRHCYDVRTPHTTALLTLLRDACGDSGGGAAAAGAAAAAAAAKGADAAAAVLADRTPSPLKTKGRRGVACGRLLAAADAESLLADPDAAAAFFSTRTVADALAEFGSPDLPVPSLLACLRPLEPRLHCVSSAPPSAGGGGVLSLTMAAPARHAGVRGASAPTHAACQLSVGDIVPVYIAANESMRLPADFATPIILIGRGAGVAPFIAFVQARKAAATMGNATLGPALLFTGCGRGGVPHALFLEAEAAVGRLTLIPSAPETDRSADATVQDRVREHGATVADALVVGRGTVYVCGDVAAVSSPVASALADVVAEHAPDEAGEAGGAEAWLDAARREGRYVEIVW